MSEPTVTEVAEELTEALDALFSMFSQYCADDDRTDEGEPMYSHACMGAGEEAADVLLKHGRITEEQLVYP